VQATPQSFFGMYLNPPKKPAPTATSWRLEEMIHEVGLPVADDPTTLDTIRGVWALRYGAKAYPTLAAANFGAWRRMAAPPNSCGSTLTGRDTAFGMRICAASGASPTFGVTMLGSDPRRTSDANIFKFIAGLKYGKDPASGARFNLGASWGTGGKDAGFLC